MAGAVDDLQFRDYHSILMAFELTGNPQRVRYKLSTVTADVIALL
jgi:hypothetical protein